MRTQHARIRGIGQLSLVEHALCPLSSKVSLSENLCHESGFHYYDKNGRKKRASTRVDAPAGLSANDEFYLWGLLALTMAEQESGIEFLATPHYCMKQLGISQKPGGKEHRIFRNALKRLSAVNYQCDRFYDPIRGERCDVSFGFLSYRLPIESSSSRAWRIAWNPIFFEFCQATSGRLQFDLQTYQQLDSASRRLFLLLRKVFWRRRQSPRFELRHLAVDVLGYSSELQIKHLRAKVLKCAQKLAELGIIARAKNDAWVERTSKGVFHVRFQQGIPAESSRKNTRSESLSNSRFHDPLSSIGFDDASIGRIIRRFKPRLIDEWADITLAAMEQRGRGFFKVSPQAYFTDNIKHASAGRRGVPDWWHEVRRQEERSEATQDKVARKQTTAEAEKSTRREFSQFLQGEGRESFDRIMRDVFRDLTATGVERSEASRKAKGIALNHMKKRFVGKQAPGASVWEFIQ